MPISAFDLYSIGIGPSSSHTVGPMRAAYQFAKHLEKQGFLQKTDKIVVDLYGSLALTGKGHATDTAVLLGLEGFKPENIDPDSIQERVAAIDQKQTLSLLQKHPIPFKIVESILFHGDKQLPYHPNAMRMTAFDASHKKLLEEVYYSTGGGFIIGHETAMLEQKLGGAKDPKVPFYFDSGDTLLKLCKEHQMTIAQIMWANERVWRNDAEIRKELQQIWEAMQKCVERGQKQEGILPGGLGVKRRAAGIYRYLMQEESKLQHERDFAEVMDWVSLWALAVNEENAAGGRVVTAPTNGAAGVIPAVMHYYMKFVKGASKEGIETFLLTAAAMAVLYKKNASISAAEMGCMGEVGVACSMAAAGLAAAMGGTPEQIENAAEIGMEHNLGLTCDPIKGLVQIPCIERNTMGATKAINAARLAQLHGDGGHRVSLDQVIATMKQTGEDMKSIYKETSQGGLAVNVPEC